MTELEQRIEALEEQVKQQHSVIVGLQNELIRAGKYRRDDGDLGKLLDGIQVLMQRAGEYQPREKYRGRKR